MLAVIGQSLVAQNYQATRLNDGKPIIDQLSFAAINPAFAKEGANINGPSVIRIPDWIPPEERADPEAVYYCYFGDHGGDYIRMAWAKDIQGPYTLYGMYLASEGKRRGVLDLGENDIIALGNGIEIRDHIASPDVHVESESKRIVMYFHGPAYFNGVGGRGLNQKTFVAYSDNGLDFNDTIQPVSLGLAYLRVFEYQNQTYALASRGNIYAAPQENRHAPPDGFDFNTDYWKMENPGFMNNPFQDDIDSDPDGPKRLRHVGLRVKGDTLEVFLSRVGDAPERILLTTIDLKAGQPSNWDPTYPPIEILRPEYDWEGANRPLIPSRTGGQTKVRQLRDPYVFEDVDAKLYLFYCGGGKLQ